MSEAAAAPAASATDNKPAAAAPSGAASDSKGAPSGDKGASNGAANGAASDASLLAGADTGGDVATPADWPGDWRERIAGKDEKSLSRLKRFASPENLYRSFAEADAKIRSGQYKRTLATDATEDEIASYRKETGVPETADKYEIGMPNGVEPTEADKAIIDHFKGVFHANHIPADMAKKMVDAFYAHQGEVIGAATANARETTINNRATLKAEYGAEYGRNISTAMSWLDGIIGADARNALVGLPMRDGTNLGDNPAFVKLMVQAALQSGDAEALVSIDNPGGAAGTIEEQYRAAINLRFTDPKAHGTPEHQKKLERLAGAVAKLRAKEGRAA